MKEVIVLLTDIRNELATMRRLVEVQNAEQANVARASTNQLNNMMDLLPKELKAALGGE